MENTCEDVHGQSVATARRALFRFVLTTVESGDHDALRFLRYSTFISLGAHAHLRSVQSLDISLVPFSRNSPPPRSSWWGGGASPHAYVPMSQVRIGSFDPLRNPTPDERPLWASTIAHDRFLDRHAGSRSSGQRARTLSVVYRPRREISMEGNDGRCSTLCRREAQLSRAR